MIKILIVEDNATKLQKITHALMQVEGVDIADITNVVDATGAKRQLKDTFFDLLILDIAIPERIDQEVSQHGGIELLNEVLARDRYKQPAHVVGMTSFEKIYTQATEHFSRESFTVIYYDPTSDDWSQKIQAKTRHILLSNKDRPFQQKREGSSKPEGSRCALVMKGGGVKALAYVGALKVLDKYYAFDWFIGVVFFFFFFFNDTATTEIYTLSLHDALPI